MTVLLEVRGLRKTFAGGDGRDHFVRRRVGHLVVEEARGRLIARLDSVYPSQERALNAMLIELLAYLQAPSAAEFMAERGSRIVGSEDARVDPFDGSRLTDVEQFRRIGRASGPGTQNVDFSGLWRYIGPTRPEPENGRSFRGRRGLGAAAENRAPACIFGKGTETQRLRGLACAGCGTRAWPRAAQAKQELVHA